MVADYTVPRTFLIDHRLVAALKEYAAQKKVTQSSVIENLLSQFLKNKEKFHDVNPA